MCCSKPFPQTHMAFTHTCKPISSCCMKIINAFTPLLKTLIVLWLQLSSHIYFIEQMHRKQPSHHHCIQVKEEKLLKLFNKFLQNQLVFIMQIFQGFGVSFYSFYFQLIIQSALEWTLQTNEGHHLLVWQYTSTGRATLQHQSMRNNSCLDPK